MTAEYIELSARQSLELTDTLQLFEALKDAEAKLAHYPGSMHWKTIKGRRYLYHMTGGRGRGRSLGPESEETRTTLEHFRHGKEEARARLKSIRHAMDEKAALNRAVGLGRVPLVVARIVRELDRQGLLGDIMLVGTHALYAYEALAGVMIYRGLLATADADFLWDNRKRADFIGSDVDGFLALLKKADRSFTRSSQPFRAVNKDGFMVDLIAPAPKDMRSPHRERMGDAYDLEAAGIGSLQWLIHSPKAEAVVVDVRGYPLRMVVPDPRSFAVHKLWLSSLASRRADKADRDREQGLLVARLILERLPQYRFTEDELKMFPKPLVDRAMAEFRGGM